MKSNEALDARLSALENLISVLILSRSVAWEKPSDEINRIFAIAYEINQQRFYVSQVGPEQLSAVRAFSAIDRVFALIARFAEAEDQAT